MTVKSYCKGGGSILVTSAVYGHRYRGIVVFESGKILTPNFTSAEVAIIDLMGKVEVYPFDIVR